MRAMQFLGSPLSQANFANLAVKFADITIVCKDGALSWNKSLLAAWSPFLRRILFEEEETILVMEDFSTSLVTICFSHLCGLATPEKIDGQVEELLCSLLLSSEKRDVIHEVIKDEVTRDTTTDKNSEAIKKELYGDGENGLHDKGISLSASNERSPTRKRLENKDIKQSRPCAPKVWIKDPSPERYLNGVKTDVYYMSAENLASGPPYICLRCDYKTPIKVNLKQHFQRKHNKEKLFKCIVCGVAKTNSWEVVGHWQRIHNPNKQEEFLKHVCDICGKMYGHTSELNTHKLLHEDVNFSCKYCGKLCKTPNARNSHEKRHESIKVSCNICGKMLAGEREAKEHEQLVHTDNSFVDCEMCGKTLKGKDNLKLHIINMHNVSEKTHQCHLCELSFRIRSLLQKHIEIVHEKSRTFSCPYCDTVLSSRYKFKKHSQKKHDGLDLPDDVKKQLKAKNLVIKVNSVSPTPPTNVSSNL